MYPKYWFLILSGSSSAILLANPANKVATTKNTVSAIVFLTPLFLAGLSSFQTAKAPVVSVLPWDTMFFNTFLK